MNTAPRAVAVLGIGFALGLLGDQLIRAQLWGANVALGITAVAGAALVLRRTRHAEPDLNRSIWPWLLAAYFALMWTVRDGEMLLAADMLAVLALASLPLVSSATLAAAGALETLAAPVRAGLHAALGAFGAAAAARPAVLRTVAGTRAPAVAVGLLIALPGVMVFGGLFASADPVFGAAVSSLISVDIEQLVSHVLITAIFGWAIAGYLWAVASPPRPQPVPTAQPGLSHLAVLTALAAVALVFLAFVATQAGSLFGGEAFIREQTGLTYAEYARGGFFQMIVASVLSLPLVYVAPFAVGAPAQPAESTSLKSLMGLQLALTTLVLLSALWRMGLYVSAYGLTEDRVYGTAVMVWVGATVVLFAATVLRGRPSGAPFGSVVAAAALLAALNLANPQAFIARYNLDHPGPRGTDVAHLSKLGADAVPHLVSRMDELSPEGRCGLATALLKRHGVQTGDWRGWNLARARARAALAGIEPLASGCPQPPTASR